MRLTVTPLGAQSASAATVARSVVNYLEGEGRSPAATLLARSVGPGGCATSYYADSIEGPGRWLGAGAAFRELAGVVEREAFQRVLEGRHPTTGERLVAARGSSQRGHLAVGTAAVFGADGNAMYTVDDAAQRLGLSVTEVAGLVDSGSTRPHAAGDAGWIGSVRQADGSALIPDGEITRLLELAACAPDPERVRAEGQRDDLLGAPDVARLLGVTRQYAARLCARGEDSGDNSRRASMPSRRGDDGNFLIRRADLAEFAEQRKSPIARVGFDLTLTVEKSIGLLAMLSDGDRQHRFVRALQRANDTAVRHMDQFASVGRRRGAVVGSEGLIVASYMHGTSRALDPHPHHHNIVANAVVDDEGGDDAVIREFSQRRSEIDEVRKALEERLGRRVTHLEENTIAKSTRLPMTVQHPRCGRSLWGGGDDRRRSPQLGRVGAVSDLRTGGCDRRACGSVDVVRDRWFDD